MSPLAGSYSVCAGEPKHLDLFPVHHHRRGNESACKRGTNPIYRSRAIARLIFDCYQFLVGKNKRRDEDEPEVLLLRNPFNAPVMNIRIDD
jgi:hypothetical protein